MTVLTLLAYLLGGAIGIFFILSYALFFIRVIAFFIAWIGGYLPFFVGITGCVYLWQKGHDNEGVIVAIIGIIMMGYWDETVGSKIKSWYDEFEKIFR